MSDSIHVFIRKSKIPSISEFQNALKESGLGLKLESFDFNDISKLDGYWPGTLDGKEAGAEFFIGKLYDEDLKDWGIKKSKVEARDTIVSLTYRGEYDYLVSVIMAAIFCQLSDGITFDEEDNLSINSKNSVQWATNQLKDYFGVQ